MDFVYSDYASWKMDYQEMIDSLKDNAIFMRFKHIYDVIEFIYAKAVNHEEVSNDEEEIFKFGYEYLFDRFEILSMILKENYDSIEEMKKEAKSINLLLYLIDFEKEAEALEKDAKGFQDLEQKVYGYIKDHTEIPDELYGLMNDLSFNVFSDEEYKGVVEIFLEIADEMGIAYFEDNVYSI